MFGFDSSYLGAKFFKCDLQMQTPMDRHWRDDSTRLSTDDSEDRKSEIARTYLRRCHEAGLEVIGVTDHNFARSPGDSFLRFLAEGNGIVAHELGRSPLFIFPGFEIEADVGRGVHVLCLFNPGTDLPVLDSRVTECGLPADKRFKANGEPVQSTKRLSDIIQIVQKCHGNEGIVICPHPTGDKGILDDGMLEIWLQKEEFTNCDLLCIEIPKRVSELSPNFQKLLSSGEDCDPTWKRQRPIACIQSSDCYRLSPSEVEATSYIGYRHSWIKMSSPSVEALRQAFLDHQSRIRLCKERPEDEYQYPLITRVQVNGATFYKADEIALSPNLNCIIGSRGAGKSTLLDYLRWAFDRIRDEDLPGRLLSEIKQRIQNTLPQSSEVKVQFIKSGIPFELVCTNSTAGPQRTVRDLQTDEIKRDLAVRDLFPVRVLSQREIDQSVDTSDRSALTRLLDDFIAPDLASLSQKEKSVRAEITSLDKTIETKEQGQTLRPQYLSTQLEMEARLKRLDAVREPLQRWTTVEAENKYLTDLQETIQGIYDRLLSEITAMIDPSAPTIESPIHGEFLKEIYEKSLANIKALRDSISDAVVELQTKALEENPDQTSAETFIISAKWHTIFESEQMEYEKLRTQLEERGDKPQDYLDFKNKLQEAKENLIRLENDGRELIDLKQRREFELSLLKKAWKEQTDLRRRKAEELMDQLKSKVGSKPLVQIKVEHQASLPSLVSLWASKIRDQRRISQDDIETVFNNLKPEQQGEMPMPEAAIGFMRSAEAHSDLTKWLSSRKADAFLEFFDEKTLREFETIRIRDEVTYTIYREDGALVGPIENVSAGQKGLAFLHLLLAGGDTPILVDTPEEGLDNEGVYTELVPVFRRTKESRQIFVITHNANIPVNADADLIACLEPIGTVDRKKLNDWIAELKGNGQDINIDHLLDLLGPKDWDRKANAYLSKNDWDDHSIEGLVQRVVLERRVEGRIRRWRSSGQEPFESCIGALDKKSVKRAVQDIMEGSEYAFQRRREKYGIL